VAICKVNGDVEGEIVFALDDDDDFDAAITSNQQDVEVIL
jgi:hypothetical protein